eukprot:13835272-Heterocapsa_arctica.AAC.1
MLSMETPFLAAPPDRPDCLRVDDTDPEGRRVGHGDAIVPGCIEQLVPDCGRDEALSLHHDRTRYVPDENLQCRARDVPTGEYS